MFQEHSLFLQQKDRSASVKMGIELPITSQHPSLWSGVNSSSYTSNEVLLLQAHFLSAYL